MDQETRDAVEERLAQVFTEVQGTVQFTGKVPYHILISMPADTEAVYRVHFRGLEDYEGGVVTFS